MQKNNNVDVENNGEQTNFRFILILALNMSSPLATILKKDKGLDEDQCASARLLTIQTHVLFSVPPLILLLLGTFFIVNN